MDRFIVKKTSELSESDKGQILGLFNNIFGQKRTHDEFMNQNIQNPFGFAYHSLYYADDKIVGHNAGVPSYYIVDGKKIKVICNIDTMISPDYRGIENYYEIMNTAYNKYKQDGFSLVIGFPNDVAHPVITSMKFLKDVGSLNTFCLPYRIGGIKRLLRPLNFFSKIFCNIYVGITSLFANSKVNEFNIFKEEDSYNRTRYKCMDGLYSSVEFNEFKLYYKVKVHEGVRTAFLIDIDKKSPSNFCKAVKYILKHERQNIDLVLYVGTLPFNNYGLIKIPKRFEPKKFNFTAKIIDRGNVDESHVYDINHWDVNLSNFDLI